MVGDHADALAGDGREILLDQNIEARLDAGRRAVIQTMQSAAASRKNMVCGLKTAHDQRVFNLRLIEAKALI